MSVTDRCWYQNHYFSDFLVMFRLNSGNRNRHNFFILAILTLKKTPTDSVNHADSGDINILVQFPGNSILKFWVKFLNCVGGTHMRRCFVPKINQ
jgi:hypothetical protein